MELIIKPTGKCNFNCKFCSANYLNIQHPKDNKVPEQIKDYIIKNDIKKLIITGGEPLMVSPDYYYELYSLESVKNISITTNLKDFYFNPNKWKDLFEKQWFGVCTSFNYGNTRMWDSNTIYTEEMFLKVMDRFKEYLPEIQVPRFIAVIDESNENTAIDHVYLAKKLNTLVKLNCAIKSGKQGKSYPRYKMFKIYNKIIDLGLSDYELNTKARNVIKCPINIDYCCSHNIRCCYIDTNGKIHFSTCDEQLSNGNEFGPDDIPIPNENDFITNECSYCDLFWLCNGCHTHRESAKEFDNFCEEMKKLEKDLKDYGWLVNNNEDVYKKKGLELEC